MIDLMSGARGAVYRALKAGVPDAMKPLVFDDVPQGTKPPFIKIGAIDSDSVGAKGDQAETLTVEVIVVYQGSDRGVLLSMMHAARSVLDRQPIAAVGIAFQPPRFVKGSASDASQADGITFAGILTFIIDGEPA